MAASPYLELYGFTISGPIAADTINSVTVAITEFQSNAAQAACSFELWDYSGTATQIGTTQTGTASTSSSNVSSATFTGVTYAMLATLRVRVYGNSATSGFTESVDGASLVVNYTPAPRARLAAGTGTALQTTGQRAGLAAATGTAISISIQAGLAGGTGTALQTTGQLAGLPSGTGTAPGPSIGAPSVAFDAVGPAGGGGIKGLTGTLSWTHIASASATLLLVVIGCGNDAATPAVTAGGVSMVTSTGSNLWKRHSNDTASGFVQVFALASPPTGSITISATGLGTAVNSSAGSISFTGTATDTSAYNPLLSAAGFTAAPTVTSFGATAISSMIFGGLCFGGGTPGGTFTATAPATLRDFIIDSASGAGSSGILTAAGASETTMASAYSNGSDYWAMTVWEIRAPRSPAGRGAAVGAALQPVPLVQPNAGLATGTGAAHGDDINPVFAVRITATPPLLSATGTSVSPTLPILTGLATVTGIALAPSIPVPAGVATGTGTAVSTAGHNAVLAAGTAVALQPSIATAGTTANAVLAHGTGAALSAAAAVIPAAGLTTGTGAAPAANGLGITVAAGTGTAQQPAAVITPVAILASGTGLALQIAAPAVLATAAGTGQSPPPLVRPNAVLAAGAGTAPTVIFSVLSPALEVSGFGSFPQVPSGSVILSVIATVLQYGSDAAITAPSYELWDSTTARIGSAVRGTAATAPGNADSVVFTGISYPQLARLRLRIYAGSATGNSGATVNVDAVSLAVTWTPNTNVALFPARLAVVPAFPSSAAGADSFTTPAVLAVVPAFPAVSAGVQATVITPGVLTAAAVFPVTTAAVSTGTVAAPGTLAVIPVFPAVSDVTGPAWATAEDIAVTGTGSWANPGNATGSPDGSLATWTVP